MRLRSGREAVVFHTATHRTASEATDRVWQPRRMELQGVPDVVFAYASGIDERNWDRYRNCFTDRCWFDFSSFMGTPASEMTADDWVARVRSVNGKFDATQHQMTNLTMAATGSDSADVRVELRAQHWFSTQSMAVFGRGDDVNWCELGGHYNGSLVWHDDAWRITRWRLTVRWRLGNMGVFTLAMARDTA